MSLFLAGVPGKLAKLVTRLAPSGYAQTLTDARVSALDNLNATVSSRAPSSTALSSAMWTDTKAGYLDAAISSVRYPVQTEIINQDASGTSGIGGLNAISPGRGFGSLTVTGGAYAEVLSVAAPGILWWAACWRGSAFTNGTLNIRITIDGVVAILTGYAAAATAQNTGAIGVGAYAGTVPILMPIRFTTSMKIEVTSSVTQSGGNDIYGSDIYTLD